MGFPAKNTWESILEEAYSLAENNDDRGVEQFERVIEGLNALPERMLDMADGRLRGLRGQAIDSLVRFHVRRGRYAEAEQVFVRELPRQDDDTRRRAPVLQSDLLWLAGDSDAAGAMLADYMRSEKSMLSLSIYFMNLLRYGQLDRAQAWLEGWSGAPDSSGAQQEFDASFKNALRSHLALARGENELAFAMIRMVMDASPGDYLTDAFVAEFVMRGRPELALPLVQAAELETMHSVWHALALRDLRRKREGDQVLRKITTLKVPDTQDDFVLAGYGLAHLYLGDQAGRGLATVLERLDEQPEFAQMLYAVAALGWAMEDDKVAARVNFQMAVDLSRWDLTGRLLNKEWWHHARRLLKPAALASYRSYFDPLLIPDRFV